MPFFFSNHIWFLLSACLLVFPLCTCVFGYCGFCFFLFCWIFVSVLEFPVRPTFSHGKSKDGIQPFKGPKPAARIANSPENRVYWAASRGRHSPVPSTCPSLLHPPHLKPPNRSAYLETNPQWPAVSFSEKQQKKLKLRTTPPRTKMKTDMTSYLAPRKEDLSSIFNHLF